MKKRYNIEDDTKNGKYYELIWIVSKKKEKYIIREWTFPTIKKIAKVTDIVEIKYVYNNNQAIDAFYRHMESV